jgi:ribonuclease HI
MALVEALKFCKKAKVKKVLVKADSQLMIRQMLGQYKVKSEGILPLFEEASRLAEAFQKIEFEHIPREKNKEADRLANSALDERRDL